MARPIRKGLVRACVREVAATSFLSSDGLGVRAEALFLSLRATWSLGRQKEREEKGARKGGKEWHLFPGRGEWLKLLLLLELLPLLLLLRRPPLLLLLHGISSSSNIGTVTEWEVVNGLQINEGLLTTVILLPSKINLVMHQRNR